MRSLLCGHAHNNRHHQGYCARVAHETTDNGRGEHHEEEHKRVVAARQLHNALAGGLGQARLEYGSANYEQAHHHDNHGGGETSKRLGRSENTKYQKGSHGTYRHNIRTKAADDEHGYRKGKDY